MTAQLRKLKPQNQPACSCLETAPHSSHLLEVKPKSPPHQMGTQSCYTWQGGLWLRTPWEHQCKHKVTQEQLVRETSEWRSSVPQQWGKSLPVFSESRISSQQQERGQALCIFFHGLWEQATPLFADTKKQNCKCFWVGTGRQRSKESFSTHHCTMLHTLPVLGGLTTTYLAQICFPERFAACTVSSGSTWMIAPCLITAPHPCLFQPSPTNNVMGFS